MYRFKIKDLLPEPVSGPLRAAYEAKADTLPDPFAAVLRQIRQKYPAACPESEPELHRRVG